MLDPAGEAAALTAILDSRYAAAFIGDPASGGVEVAGNGYARVAAGTFSQTGSNPTTASNDGIIEFPVATGTWGTVTHVALFDALTDGNRIARQALDVSKLIEEDFVLRFPVGALQVEAD